MVNRKQAIQQFLTSGEHDPSHIAWPGDVLQRCGQAEHDLRQALVQEVHRRSAGRSHPVFEDIDYRTFARGRVEPMVRGLFPPAEQEPMLLAIEKSVVFLGANQIEAVIMDSASLHTAWVLANIYLDSLGADVLGPDAPRAVGLSEETTYYVSTEYFHEKDRFADFLVHEAAHLFHNCRRRSVGLRETTRRPCPLTIDFRKREEFAFACEFYSRILALSSGSKDRQRVFGEFRAGFKMSVGGMDSTELLITLEEDVTARNGWKRILARCSSAPRAPRKGWGNSKQFRS